MNFSAVYECMDFSIVRYLGFKTVITSTGNGTVLIGTLQKTLYNFEVNPYIFDMFRRLIRHHQNNDKVKLYTTYK